MNQKPFRTLMLWSIWAATAIVVYITLYSDTNVWQFIEQDSSKVTWLILGLFVLGLVGSFALTLMVTQEAYRAQQLENAAREGGLNAISVGSLKRAADRFFQSLKSTLDSKGQPQVETLLDVELAVYGRISHTVEVIGNLLITLGLIGTVMGLTLTLTGLTGSLDALGHDQEQLLAGLRKAMSGMGTAFYTTLLGAVLGGVLLRVFAQITQHGVEGLHDDLLRICMVYCSSDYAQSLERDVRLLNEEIRTLDRNMAELQQVFQSSQDVVRQFKDEIHALDETSEEGESLHVLLQKHREYCEMLRQDMRLLAHVNKPFLIRLAELFRNRR